MWESAGERIKRLQRDEVAQVNPARVTVDKPVTAGISLAHYQTAMSVDVARLSTLKVMEEKQAAKRNMLATYLEFVTDYVFHAQNYPNSVAVQYMIWLFDVGDIEAALGLAFYLAPHQQMPDRFARRDIQTFICDAVYDWEKQDSGTSGFSKRVFARVIEELEAKGWDLSPPVASKTYVKAAKLYYTDGDYKRAVDCLEKAKTANPEGWGAKTLLANAKAKL